MAGDEQIRAQIMRPRQTLELTGEESWQLLSSVPLGRIVFTLHAMPAIRPVDHLADDQTIIIRSHLGPAIAGRAAGTDGAVVCYQAGELDPARHTGWSVIATGMARLSATPSRSPATSDCQKRWVAVQMDHVIDIKPGIHHRNPPRRLVPVTGWCLPGRRQSCAAQRLPGCLTRPGSLSIWARTARTQARARARQPKHPFRLMDDRHLCVGPGDYPRAGPPRPRGSRLCPDPFAADMTGDASRSSRGPGKPRSYEPVADLPHDRRELHGG